MTSPEDDPLAMAVVFAYCGWDIFPSVTTTVQLDGNGTKLLTLPSMYVTNVSAVSITDWQGGVTALTIGPAGDVGWSENGCLTLNGCALWPVGQRNVAVTFTGGYDGPNDDLLAAMASLSKRTATGATFGVTQRRMGTASVSFSSQVTSGDFLTVERMVFDKYRMPRVS